MFDKELMKQLATIPTQNREEWFAERDKLETLAVEMTRINAKDMVQKYGIARVKLHYTSLPELIGSLKDIPVYGTFLDGENMYTQPLSAYGLIVMGNEGNGIGKEVEQLINRKLYIPNYPSERETSESLNVAIATAVICAEFRRQATSL